MFEGHCLYDMVHLIQLDFYPGDMRQMKIVKRVNAPNVHLCLNLDLTLLELKIFANNTSPDIMHIVDDSLEV